MALSDFISVLTSLLTLSIASGLIFAILVQPLRTRVNLYFALFAFSVSIWSAGSIFRNLNQDVISFDDKTQFDIQAIGFVLSVISFYFFLVSFLQASYRLLRPFSRIGIPVGILSVILVLAGEVTNWTEDEWSFTPIGYGLFSFGIAYLLVAIWLIYQENTRASRTMRLPAVLMIAGMTTNFIPVLSQMPVDSTTRSIVMVLVGWQILRFQLFNPMHEMNRDLAAKNKALHTSTQELKAEKLLIFELNQQLQQANQYKDTFLASMSHELRTPLNAIIGYSELLLQGSYGNISDKQRNRTEKIHINAIELLELINDILDLSKIEAGKIELELENLALPAIVDKLKTTIEPQAEKKKLRFITVWDETLTQVQADSTRIHQVLVNLLSNAVKFTKEGSVTLKMQNIAIQNGQCEAVSSLPDLVTDGKWVLVSVQDTGIGIAKENYERIFEAFRQADERTTRQFGGSGLGLAIARRFVEMHKGHIWVESELGKGATFHIVLPAIIEPAMVVEKIV